MLANLIAQGALAYLSDKQQERTNEVNQETAREQMAFQERMSSTAYQRATADMSQAGLNPMLAYQQGGAAAPAGASSTALNPLQSGVATASQALQTATAMKQSQANTDLIGAQADKVRSETMDQQLNTAWLASQIKAKQLDALSSEENIPKIRAEAKQAAVKSTVEQGGAGYEHTGFYADVQRRKAEAQLSQLEIPKAKAEANFMQTDFGEQTPLIRSILQLLRGTTSAYRALH